MDVAVFQYNLIYKNVWQAGFAGFDPWIVVC